MPPEPWRDKLAGPELVVSMPNSTVGIQGFKFSALKGKSCRAVMSVLLSKTVKVEPPVDLP